ncbi:PREDICTED: LOW QUALITY PROTEIN: protein phosphatase 1 regulatory subunit 12A [Camelina sativa]|uniref:LOW QUALITY PROTEIN: protein phosphatase 1 regulatory subunit 12A n=1 Tax=Camelina sativa TaxID=90675 RepID=A0ABM0VPP2_CAMSA|nr:PREDICTED: LOW QUALITY PROTEIN: protein phosphatase 1 regulatory subunit 12A [Camelina sativa]
MKADTVLDYAVFELSPKHSRCELFVWSNEENEKLASGLIQPFLNHLRVLESQASQRTESSIRLDFEKSENGLKSWFTKRTLERFVQYVSSPELLERVNTFDLEMSQLEAARTLYSQEDGGVADATKKELSRAIDLRLEAIKKDLTTAITHASANGFDPQTVSDLQHFADRFGAHRLDEACGKYISLSQRRPDLITKNLNTNTQTSVNETHISTHQSTKSSTKDEEEKNDESLEESSTVKTIHHTRRLSVQDRINLFESKQKEISNSTGNKPVVVAKSTELKRLSSDVSSAFPEKSVLRRWSIVSDMSFDFTMDNKKSDCGSTEEGLLSTPSSIPDSTFPKESEENSTKEEDDVRSSKSGDFQNQTDRPGNVMTDSNSMQSEEENYASKSQNVAQSSVMFPYRHSRSRSAHVAGGIDIKSDERQSKGRKKELFPSDRQPALKTSTKPVSAGSDEQRQKSCGVEDDLEVSLVNAESAGKSYNNRVRATSVDQTQRTRMSRESLPGFNDELQIKAGDDKDHGNVVMRRNLSELRFSDDSKGKLYEEYMTKRDAKLREEWSSKETKLKSMQEALDRSRTEMKAKFSTASVKRQDSISSTRQRAEKFRSFNSRTSTKKCQHPISSLQSEEENEKEKPVSGQPTGKSASRSSQVRKAPSPNRSSRVSKPSGKVSNTNINTSGRGRKTADINLVAQSSLPKFSDLKKENTKPSSLAGRNTTTTTMMRTQVRSSNKKTSKEDIPSPVVPRRPRSLRKSFSANIEFTELTTLYSDDIMNNERNQKQNTEDNEDVSENFKVEELDDLESEAEEEEKEVLDNAVKEEEEEAREMETLVVEDIGDETPSLTEIVENSSEDENFTTLRSVSHVNLPANTLPSSTLQHNVASLLDSPSESPLSWSSNLQHAFSYPHEHSDVDASVDDSPMGSPASWSSRMRKKWGSTAQSPVLVPNSRKDLTKGIKRFLKFGKKTRAADSLMDWVSVTTSEGDDDFAYRSSDELRKSRMASSQSQFSEDEQALNNLIQPHHHQGSFKVKDGEFKRSFFSLSTFRSKGNDSKPR